MSDRVRQSSDRDIAVAVLLNDLCVFIADFMSPSGFLMGQEELVIEFSLTREWFDIAVQIRRFRGSQDQLKLFLIKLKNIARLPSCVIESDGLFVPGFVGLCFANNFLFSCHCTYIVALLQGWSYNVIISGRPSFHLWLVSNLPLFES